MVKITFLITLSAFLTSAILLAAGEFTASVSTPQVHLNHNFTFILTLKNTSPKEAPDVSVLKKDFLIHSQQHSNNISFVNGKVSTNTTWKLSLTPTKEGTQQISSISIDTAEGPLSTQPITINVSKSAHPQNADNIKIITKVSNASPYKNEPLVYTALLASKLPLYNLQAHKLQVKDAIAELWQDPKLEERVLEGVLHHVVEITYMITPLKAGSLTIPPLAIQGAVPQKRRDLDPFAVMQGFDLLKPFTMMTEELQLAIQAAVPEVNPWLPARELTLEEVWPSDQPLRVGEPFTRSFLIKGEGLQASQLPHLEQSQGSAFKVYADKPEEQDTVSQDSIHSLRKEQYTLIPQHAGTWVLPEVSVSWWDTAKKEKKTSALPSRTLHILPALGTAPHDAAPAAPTASSTAPEAPIPSLLYGTIALLALSLLATLIWCLTLQRKIARQAKQNNLPTPKKPTPPPSIPKV